MTHCVAGHESYIDTLRKNYGCQDFFLKVSYIVTHKDELFMSFIASVSVL